MEITGADLFPFHMAVAVVIRATHAQRGVIGHGIIYLYRCRPKIKMPTFRSPFQHKKASL